MCIRDRYEEIEEMPLSERVLGMIANYLQEKDEHKVISDCLYPPLPRYDASSATQLEGESRNDFNSFKATWSQMDLTHVYGFPLWEKEVFELLHATFEGLRSIFDYYAKSGTAGSASAASAQTMQQTELQNLALDCGLSSEQFSMTRVINIFARADQVDDTFKVSAADRRVMTGETAKGGDGGLELHEFLEAVVMLAFHRAQPKFGSVGHNDMASVSSPLPGCLETLLKKHLLKKAKTDTLAKVRKMVEKLSLIHI